MDINPTKTITASMLENPTELLQALNQNFKASDDKDNLMINKLNFIEGDIKSITTQLKSIEAKIDMLLKK